MAENIGRPRKFETATKLNQDIDRYFKYCDDNDKPYTVTGLAAFFETTRDVLSDYESGKYDDGSNLFSSTIKKAKAKILAYAEECLYNRNKFTPGVIFSLKNNYGWTDKQEISTPPGQPIEINSGLKGASEAELQEILRFVRQQTAEKH